MRIRQVAVAALLLWAVLSQVASAATFIQIFSQPGDVQGRGVQRTFGPASAIQAFTYGTQVEVHFDGGVGDLWVFGFAAPSGALVPGDYPNARSGTPGSPFFVVTGQNRGCADFGRFTVLEIALASDGSPTKVAIDFELHCESEVPALFGGIRFNSALPYNITSTPPLPPQGPTFIQLVSQQGDYIGQGRQRTLTDSDGKISVVTNLYGGATAQVALPLNWNLEFGPAPGQTFGTGTYANAERFGFASAGHPRLDVGGEGRGCNTITGRFVVLEWVPHTESSWARLAVDFEQHCEGGSAALFGSVRFNSTVPYVPPAIAPIATRLAYVNSPHDFAVRRGATSSGLDVRTVDDAGNPVAGARVTFTTFGCGHVGGASTVDAVSDSRGIASASFTAPSFSATCTVSATLTGTSRVLEINFYVYDPSELTLTAQPGPSIDTTVGQPFRVGVTVALRQLVIVDLSVEFRVVATGGPGVTSIATTVKTDTNGTAMSDAMANDVAGNYTIEMNAGGATKTIQVQQRAAGAPPATRSVRLTAPDGQPIILAAFTSEGACAISRAQIIDPRAALFTADGVPPATLAFPRGFLDFRVDNCGAGQPVSFVVEFANPLPPTAAYWKFGPTPDNRTAHWYPMPGTIDGTRFTFTITDGGLGDDDLTANGSISDMGGLAFNGGTLQDLWWSGTAENGWGMSIIQHGDVLFANVYVYDSAGKPMWLVIPGGAWNASHTAFSGALYIPHGAPFFSYDVSRFSIGAPVGTATFTFPGENNAVFDFTINGVAGRKNITRLSFGRPDLLAATPGVGDLWWGGVAQNGWGITVLQQVRTLFSLWFTYDADGAPTWYVMPGGDWTASDTYEGRIYRAVGSAWVGATYDPTQHRTIDVGSYRLRFTGDAATFDYTIDGRTGSLPLTRLAF